MKLLKTKLEGTDISIYYQNEDRYIGQRVAMGKYEPYLTKLMLEQIKEGEVVVDVGANIGYDTVLFAKKAGPTGKVYAFEPEPVNFEILLRNIKANKLENVTAVQSALGEKEGLLTLYKSEENLGDHRLFEPDDKGKTKKEKVKIIRLDDYLAQAGEKRKISLIKIDTQGWEPAVIEGAEMAIKRDKPTIFLEYWPWAYRRAGLNKEIMMDRLIKEYGWVNFIDEYIRVYYPVRPEYLDMKYKDSDEIRYGNIWVNERKDQPYFWGMVKDFWPKKLAKRLLGRPQT